MEYEVFEALVREGWMSVFDKYLKPALREAYDERLASVEVKDTLSDSQTKPESEADQ